MSKTQPLHFLNRNIKLLQKITKVKIYRLKRIFLTFSLVYLGTKVLYLITCVSIGLSLKGGGVLGQWLERVNKQEKGSFHIVGSKFGWYSFSFHYICFNIINKYIVN